MRPIHLPAPSIPLSAPSPSAAGGPWRLWPLLASALLLTACTAPGMKLNSRPSDPPRTTEVEGLSVTLRPLNGQTLQALDLRGSEPVSLGALAEKDAPTYLIGPQDILLVTVWDHPEITLPLGQYRQDTAAGTVVDEKGEIYFPYVGRFRVAGMSTGKVRDELASRLGRVLQNPQVDVKVIAFRSQKVYIGGEVRNPGVYPVTDVPCTLTEAVNRAGGLLPTADDSRLTLVRDGKATKLNFQVLMSGGGQGGRLYLKDGDTLQVPNVQDTPVYMLGELVRPGTTPLIHGNLSLAQAIQEVGGIQGQTADPRSIYVIRQGAALNGVDVYHLDARNPTAMILADRFALHSRDIVYVDKGTIVRWGQVMGLILPTYTGLLDTATSIKYLGQPRTTR